MFEAQYLTTKLSAGFSVFSPWFPRGGDRIRYTLDLIQAEGATVAVELFHKESNDTGNGSTTGSSISATSTIGQTRQEYIGGLKDMVRYKFTVAASSNGTIGMVLFRMLPPVWFDAALNS